MATTAEHVENYFKFSFQSKFLMSILNHMNIRPGLHCLDIGCGTGNSSAIVASMVGESGSVLGIDPDQSRIDLAVEKHKQCYNLKFANAKSTNFPFIEEGYDVVTCNCVLHWCNYDEKVETFKRVFGSLKPGGLFGVNSLQKFPVNYLKLARFLCSEEEILPGLIPVYLISDDAITELISSTGFEIVCFESESHSLIIDNEIEYTKCLDASLLNGKFNLMKVFQENHVEYEKFSDGKIKHQSDYTKIILKKPLCE